MSSFKRKTKYMWFSISHQAFLWEVKGKRAGLPRNDVVLREYSGPQGKPVYGHSDKEQELGWRPVV